VRTRDESESLDWAHRVRHARREKGSGRGGTVSAASAHARGFHREHAPGRRGPDVLPAKPHEANDANGGVSRRSRQSSAIYRRRPFTARSTASARNVAPGCPQCPWQRRASGHRRLSEKVPGANAASGIKPSKSASP